MEKKFLFLFLISICFADRRPFYNIAHMANSLRLLDEFLKKGANAIEIDIDFKKDGEAVNVFHGEPCDCDRECNSTERFTKYLDVVRVYAQPGHSKYRKNFTLLMLDLKAAKIEPSLKRKAGEMLADTLIKHIFEGGKTKSKINIQIAIQYTQDADIVRGLMNRLEAKRLQHLNKRIGWEIGADQPLKEIQSVWQSFPGLEHIWQGDGDTNCKSSSRSTSRLKDILKMREKCKAKVAKHCFKKVYQWTIDAEKLFRSALRLGVDGIITNHPERLIKILNEREFKANFRLANNYDDPWSLIGDEIKYNENYQFDKRIFKLKKFSI
ncbi:hypothetical protein B4U79_09966 [Dinothrombium tinctorium]|uniref:Uncharacterized protein n=1 Tax=Dinothrombium tinctorium TaxID=1965070 RepID=A0A3S3P7V8_9ACAR|nr:hypothetical protein B4U79_05152 [Dinothrombium tinctorium]RWS09391.1 hypothetical protein B4U79_13230 [Dinothrombium tinctorium]RWS09804.1 hypothetical protein B4U79_09966 [Dinothrombium tinctorium]